MVKTFHSAEDMVYGQFMKLKKNLTVPYAWKVRTIQERKLMLRVGNSVQEIMLDKALEKQEFWVG